MIGDPLRAIERAALPFRPTSTSQRLTPRLAVLSAVLVCVLIGLYARGWRQATSNDFNTTYAAAHELLHGRTPYGTAIVWRDTHYASGLEGRPPQSAYVYPPLLAVLVTPLTVLPVHAAALVWYLIACSCVVASAWLLVRLLLPGPSPWRLPAALLLAVAIAGFGPVRLVLAAGQVDTVLLCLLVLCLGSLSAGRPQRAAFWLALAVAVKPFLAVLALYFLWKRLYRVTTLLCLLAGGLIVLPFFALGALGTLGAHGVQALRDFISVLLYFSGATFGVSPHNQGPYGLLLRLFTSNAFTVPLVNVPGLATALRWLITAVVLAALARFIPRAAARDAERVTVEFGLAVAGMLLISPHAESYHYVYLVLPLVAIAWSIWSASGRAGTSWVALGAVAVYLYLSLPGLDSAQYAFQAYAHGAIAVPRSLLTGVYLYGLCALAGLLLAAVCLSERATNCSAAGGT